MHHPHAPAAQAHAPAYAPQPVHPHAAMYYPAGQAMTPQPVEMRDGNITYRFDPGQVTMLGAVSIAARATAWVLAAKWAYDKMRNRESCNAPRSRSGR